MDINKLVTLAVAQNASDIHLKAGLIPMIRKNGELLPLNAEAKPLTPDDMRKMAYGLMPAQQIMNFEKRKEADLSFGIPGVGRFRVNISQQRGTIRIVLRTLKDMVPTMAELCLPEMVKNIAEGERGLVLVTGTTGSGKSSTLASMIGHINSNYSGHILTIEDPIEFIIPDKKCIVTQRELWSDTNSFSDALRGALRQDPDVIFFGEMRDAETIDTALLAAETGHLVLSTLHTVDATETISRIVAAYPPNQQTQIRFQLAGALRAIISQRLAKRKDGTGLIPAVEIMVNNVRTKEMIIDPARTKNLITAIEEGHEMYGMQSFDQHIMQLVTEQLISYEEGLRLSSNPANFALRFKGITSMDGQKWQKFDQKTSVSEVVTMQFEVEKTELQRTPITKNQIPPPPDKKKRA